MLNTLSIRILACNCHFIQCAITQEDTSAPQCFFPNWTRGVSRCVSVYEESWEFILFLWKNVPIMLYHTRFVDVGIYKDLGMVVFVLFFLFILQNSHHYFWDPDFSIDSYLNILRFLISGYRIQISSISLKYPKIEMCKIKISSELWKLNKLYTKKWWTENSLLLQFVFIIYCNIIIPQIYMNFFFCYIVTMRVKCDTANITWQAQIPPV